MKLIRTDFLVGLKIYVFFVKTFFEVSFLSSAGRVFKNLINSYSITLTLKTKN